MNSKIYETPRQEFLKYPLTSRELGNLNDNY
jgi:hypothetical protein